jgi:hypothetical protein
MAFCIRVGFRNATPEEGLRSGRNAAQALALAGRLVVVVDVRRPTKIRTAGSRGPHNHIVSGDAVHEVLIQLTARGRPACGLRAQPGGWRPAASNWAPWLQGATDSDVGIR